MVVTKKPDPEQRDEIGHPDGGIPPDFGDGSNVPDQGIRHRGNPPAPLMDAPIPPQDIEEDGGEEEGDD